MEKGLEIFCCYAHEDKALLIELKKHLRLLQYQGLATIWSDSDISPGENWEEKISYYLSTAPIILLLVSPDFIASDYCYSIEMKRALERHEQGEAYVIPIILRWCGWQKTPLGKLQALPSEARPVKSWSDLDEAFFDISEGLQQLIDAKSQGIVKKRVEQQKLVKRKLLAEWLRKYREMLDKLNLADESTYLERLEHTLFTHPTHNPSYRILVVGEFKTGKSTFINSMIGEKILPTSALPNTAVITELKWRPEPRVLLHFRQTKGTVTKQPQEININQLHDISLHPGSEEIPENLGEYEKFEVTTQVV